MLTHCVHQLANFWMREVRVITDTSFISWPANFFYLASFFHEPILKFVGFLGKGSLRNSLEKHYPFIGGSANWNEYFRVPIECKRRLSSVALRWAPPKYTANDYMDIWGSIGFSATSMEKGSKNHTQWEKLYICCRESLWYLQIVR